ncbi:DMT family transporter [Geomonas sp. Red32]|uniref:DMT family transporter n=1 Tax=Geomonas sp. Red32 TaxID=2912856 RepID=UPI00202D0B77|nr:DMT family transporter [Geomonas sp. Red32]MCM0080252.1 DMT family transporter [Geomonas sp. Red32]
MLKKGMAALLLLVTTFFWGVTFTVVKDAVAKADVFVFLAQRFFVGFALLVLLCLVKRRALTRATAVDGAVLGFLLFLAFAFQTVALCYTSATNTGFLTGLNVVLVPLLGALFFRQQVTLPVGLGVTIAAAGLFLLCTGGKGLTLNPGDLLAAICAVCVALHLLYTSRFARKGGSDVFWLTAVQIGTVFALSLLVALGRGKAVLVLVPGTGWAIAICALFATVFAFLVQTSMQRVLSPAHTALIFCCEPVFAALYAYRFGNEVLGEYGMAGAGLIVASMLVSELLPAPGQAPLMGAGGSTD